MRPYLKNNQGKRAEGMESPKFKPNTSTKRKEKEVEVIL
jgi:hypothetical protein